MRFVDVVGKLFPGARVVIVGEVEVELTEVAPGRRRGSIHYTGRRLTGARAGQETTFSAPVILRILPAMDRRQPGSTGPRQAAQ